MIINFNGGGASKKEILEIVANAGFLSEEHDPGFATSPVATITSDDISNWNNKQNYDDTALRNEMQETKENVENAMDSIQLVDADGIELVDADGIELVDADVIEFVDASNFYTKQEIYELFARFGLYI